MMRKWQCARAAFLANKRCTTNELTTSLLLTSHGYRSRFLDRQWLLQTLYDHIQHKERVLVNKRVKGIELVPGGAEVLTTDGHTYHGTIVVGADGIHSAVRSEMFRLGDVLEPGLFDAKAELERTTCYSWCIFGISRLDGLPKWNAHQLIQGRGISRMVISAPGDRVYWFLLRRLPKPLYGDDIPRGYSKDEEEAFAEAFGDIPIMAESGVKFKDLYSRRIVSNITPLHEIVFKRWYFRRLITLGDSAAKVSSTRVLLSSKKPALMNRASGYLLARTHVSDCE
jgi:2-polyprenyl-6-methoxyphenol hydroxylase-like FAD-dependent oxidoreductase